MKDDIRKAIMQVLKRSYQQTLLQLHESLGGRYTHQEIEAELIALDLERLIVNDSVPVVRISPKGLKAA